MGLFRSKVFKTEHEEVSAMKYVSVVDGGGPTMKGRQSEGCLSTQEGPISFVKNEQQMPAQSVLLHC